MTAYVEVVVKSPSRDSFHIKVSSLSPKNGMGMARSLSYSAWDVPALKRKVLSEVKCVGGYFEYQGYPWFPY